MLLNKLSGSGYSKIDHTVIFTVDDAPYEMTSVKNGNQINAPLTDPTSENGVFKCWEDENGNKVVFPYEPTSDIKMIAAFQSALLADLYSHYNVPQETYPYIFIIIMTTGETHLLFAGDYTHDAKNLDVTTVKRGYTKNTISTFGDMPAIVDHVKTNITSLTSSGTYGFGSIGTNHHIYTNADIPLISAQVHKLI